MIIITPDHDSNFYESGYRSLNISAGDVAPVEAAAASLAAQLLCSQQQQAVAAS